MRLIFKFCLISTIIGLSWDVNGASLENHEVSSDLKERQVVVTLQDLKNYIQPIIYQKILLARGDSPIMQQAKTVVSEYLADSLIESVALPPPSQDSEVGAPAKLRPSLKQRVNNTSTGTNNILTVAGTQLVQAVAGGNRNRTRPSQQHVLNQVDQIVQNVNGANITGIVDQALLIRAPAPVRQLVNGILNSVLCNPFNRLWNRCAGGGSLLFPNNPS